MRKMVIVALLAFSMANMKAKAQATFPTIDSITINNIKASVLVHGDMWWDPKKGISSCYLNDSSPVAINFAGSLWMSGYDGSGALHIAAQTYRQAGNDYWPGPLDGSGSLPYSTSSDWAKIWKINRTDIQYFQSLTVHTITNTPPAILTWPAKGNINAQGNGGAALTITDDMAPFVDVNHNGIYEPLLGDYPDVQGDQALWWVFSDNGPTHSQTNGNPLKVEVHAMAYGYSRGTLMDNVVYYDYAILNKSINNYNNFRIAQWDHPDLGYYLGNFIGFDSVWRMGIIYNSTNNIGGGAGHPPGSTNMPPMSAVTMIVLPGDVATSYVPVGSFTFYNNDLSAIGNPTIDTEFNNYMRSKLKNGQHFTDDFAGAGIPSKAYGSGPDCNYVFTGDPGNTSQWSECVCQNNPADKRFILSSNDFTFNAGTTQRAVFALIAADSTGGCPTANFDSIKIVADTAWQIYFNPPPPKPASVANTPYKNTITIYPNPVHDKLIIENTGTYLGQTFITIYNGMGQVVGVPITTNGQKSEADISQLPAGLYNVLYRQNSEQRSLKFIKE